MRQSVAVLFCLLAALVALGPSPARAYGVHQEAKLVAADGQDGDHFGIAALDGDNISCDRCSAGCVIEQVVPATSPVGVLLLILALGGSAAYFVRRLAH